MITQTTLGAESSHHERDSSFVSEPKGNDISEKPTTNSSKQAVMGSQGADNSEGSGSAEVSYATIHSRGAAQEQHAMNGSTDDSRR